MSISAIVLYGSRLYDAETFSTNQDPQSLSLSLSDSTTLSDVEITSMARILADAITMAESWKSAGNKPLSDSTTMTEALAKAIVRSLSDSVTMTDTEAAAITKALTETLLVADAIIVKSTTKSLSDSLTMTETRLIQAVKYLTDSISVADASVLIRQVKGFSEFILLNDWLELTWKKADVWNTTPAFGSRPSKIHNYGPGVYYGVDFYSSNPSVYWLLQAAKTAVWRQQVAAVEEIQLYAKTTYGSKVYSATPMGGWTRPTDTGRQNWKNANGESHN